MTGISILGSTGSIGRNALEVIRRFPDHFKVVGLAAKSNFELLEEQVRLFKPRVAALEDKDRAGLLKERLADFSMNGRGRVEVISGAEGMEAVAAHPDSGIVLSAMVGAAGLIPSLEAVRAKKKVLLANKEVLVMAGSLFMKEVRARNVKVIPVDSEHSAIFQCLDGKALDEVSNLILTASGGPFFDKTKKELEHVTAEEALRHPNWKMGPKITIDSATMMNKGLELIEAYWLFGLPESRITVLVHPQSIVHSMVEFIDGSVMAQLGVPDMKIPIQYALSYPARLDGSAPRLNLAEIGTLTFQPLDLEKFPAVRLAKEALHQGGTWPAVLNAANEIAVSRFLEGEIRFLDIPVLVERLIEGHRGSHDPGLEEILEADRWAREEACKWNS